MRIDTKRYPRTVSSETSYFQNCFNCGRTATAQWHGKLQTVAVCPQCGQTVLAKLQADAVASLDQLSLKECLETIRSNFCEALATALVEERNNGDRNA